MAATNPFPPRRNAADPGLRARGRQLARQTARGGAAKGAILAKLRAIGLGDVDADELADAALRAHGRRRRIKGIGISLTGALIVLVAVALFPFVIAKFAIMVGVFGAFFVMLGVAQWFS
ncbi:hypothetical protein Mal15_34330 [Stieleria maiorica]|uniref:Uncharacterized protein n=1 Tax=Stieleria maiorica TaxID=2795974 RepID=A0A5B9MFS7_9BACT|nr:hypothetical protein [Stieleria maiorica]QEF99369.1 hypothetical protein Mal15_34330 [Stieleria maiorica]